MLNITYADSDKPVIFVLSQLRDSPESLNLSLGLSRVYTLSPA